MLFASTPLIDRLYDQICTMPVIDCHEHMVGPAGRSPYKEPISSLIRGYVLSDLMAAGFGVSERDWLRLQDEGPRHRIQIVEAVLQKHANRLVGNFSVATEKSFRVRSRK